MLFSDKMNAAINEQIGREFAASLEYVSIASSPPFPHPRARSRAPRKP